MVLLPEHSRRVLAVKSNFGVTTALYLTSHPEDVPEPFVLKFRNIFGVELTMVSGSVVPENLPIRVSTAPLE
jgi:hypothetical protein